MQSALVRLSVMLCVLLSCIGGATAQIKLPALFVDCGGAYDLCGFRDRQTLALVVERKFERALPFSEGLAAVRVQGQFGFIDESGTIVIQPSFDLAGGFFQGLAEVLVGDQTGVIDRQGRFVAKPQFKRSVPFTKDVVLVREGKWAGPDFFGRAELGTLSDYFTLSGDEDVWGLYHLQNGWLKTNWYTKTLYHLRVFETSGAGLIWAKPSGSPKSLFGLLRADGKWEVEPRYETVSQLKDGRAVVGGSSGLQGAVDPNGKLAISLKQWSLYHTPRNGLIPIKQDGREGFIDKDGNLVGGRLFEKVDNLHEGDVARVMIDGEWVGFTRDGSLFADQEGGAVVASCPSGVKLLKKYNGMQIIGADDKPTTSFLFELVYYFPFSCDRPNPVRIGDLMKPDGKWGFVGTDGKLLLGVLPFDEVTKFTNGYAMAKKDGKWGVVDANGKFVIEPLYDQLTPSSLRRSSSVNGLGLRFVDEIDHATVFEAKVDGRDLAISIAGSEVAMPPKPAFHERYLWCQDGSKFVAQPNTQNGTGVMWGIADKDGRELIKPSYRAMHCFESGVAWAAIDAKRQWCPVDPDGRVRDKPACMTVRYPYTITHSSPQKVADDPYESSVLWMRQYLEYGSGRRQSPPKREHDFGGLIDSMPAPQYR